MNLTNKISIRSTLVLTLLGALAIALLVIVENSKDFRRQDFYTEKVKAAELAAGCMIHLKERFFEDEIAIDNINDPNETGIIGQQFSEITSGRGSLPVKLSTTNPNFAAMIVEQLKRAGVSKGDKVAMCFTGSFPALNIAAMAAVETLGAKPVLITSVTSSSWGANAPELTWPDMHRELYEKGFVSFMPVASSIGGNEDVGRTLSKEGRQLAFDAIERNGLRYINEGNLEGNIARRMDLFQEDGQKIKAFINVGGGIASLGSNANADQLPSGLQTELNAAEIPDKQGVVYEMMKSRVPVINLLHINRLMDRYELPRDPVPLPPIGQGKLYEAYKYNLKIVGTATLVFLGLILAVMYYDKKQNKLGTQIIKEHV